MPTPLKILAYRWQYRGHHLAPVEKWKEKYTYSPDKFYHFPRADSNLVENFGNLPEYEYHWWIGAYRKETRWAECRSCHYVIQNPPAEQLWRLMNKHYMESACSTILSIASEISRRKQICVVCSQECTDIHWEIYIHLKCRNAWRWSNVGFKIFEAALSEAKKKYLV